MKANTHSNAIDEELLQTVLQGLDSLLQAIEPVVTPLTPQDRQTLPKMGEKTLAFVEKSHEFAMNNPVLVPNYLDVNEGYCPGNMFITQGSKIKHDISTNYIVAFVGYCIFHPHKSFIFITIGKSNRSFFHIDVNICNIINMRKSIYNRSFAMFAEHSPNLKRFNSHYIPPSI